MFKKIRRIHFVGIGGIDTRALVLLLRTKGAQMAVIATGPQRDADLVAKARALPDMNGMDLTSAIMRPRECGRRAARRRGRQWSGNGSRISAM